MKKLQTIIILFITCFTLLSACNKSDEDQTVPGYIEVKGFKVVDNPNSSVSQFEGCFTSNINAVEITISNSSESKTIGVFELPCKVPVLKEGMYTVSLKPAIKLNGISATRSGYPFYNDVEIKNINFSKDQTVVIDTQNVYYNEYVRFVWQEYFEPNIPNISLPDTVVRIVNALDTVRSDRGSGVVYTPVSKTSVSFITNESYTVTDRDALILEMDYMTNVPLQVGMKLRTTDGGTEYTDYAMTLNPNMEKGWSKIYIQLGKLWSNYYYYKTFKIAFNTINKSGIEGKTYIDNIKLTAYKNSGE